jgi:ADP-ribose pyrophosphatase YjhB (NUDIX family)
MSASSEPLRLGVWCAAFRRDHVLLSRRADLNVWSLPGGRLDAGERLQDAAVREVAEETGVQALQPQPAALYYMHGWQRLNVLFRAQAEGQPLGRSAETRENVFFPAQALPWMPLGQVVTDAVDANAIPPRVVTLSPAEQRQLRLRLGLRYLWNALRGQPEPRFPRFEVQAAALIADEAGRVLTVRSARDSELRGLPRVRCDGRQAPWAQLRAHVLERTGVEASLIWAGVLQDAPRGRYEFVFTAQVASGERFRAGEWSAPRTAVLHDRDAQIIGWTRAGAPWIRDVERPLQAGDTVSR